MIDIKNIEKEAAAELAKEQGGAAKEKIKASLRKIANAETVLVNLRHEHQVLLASIGGDA